MDETPSEHLRVTFTSGTLLICPKVPSNEYCRDWCNKVHSHRRFYVSILLRMDIHQAPVVRIFFVRWHQLAYARYKVLIRMPHRSVSCQMCLGDGVS